MGVSESRSSQLYFKWGQTSFWEHYLGPGLNHVMPLLFALTSPQMWAIDNGDKNCCWFEHNMREKSSIPFLGTTCRAVNHKAYLLGSSIPPLLFHHHLHALKWVYITCKPSLKSISIGLLKRSGLCRSLIWWSSSNLPNTWKRNSWLLWLQAEGERLSSQPLYSVQERKL